MDKTYLALSSVHTVIFSQSGTTIGLALRVCGHIETITKAFKAGFNTGQPAESPYAVEPVGVATIIPSA